MSASRRLALALVLILVPLLAPSGARAEGAARVETFAPEGTAKGVREASARFSAPMIALGDPRSARDPFEVDCPAPGRARWADARTWVFVFERDLPAGLRCRFTLRDGVRTAAGAPVGGRRDFDFSTGGPAVLQVVPWGGQIAEDQRFVLKLDAEATPDSLERHVSFATSGLREPIGVRVVPGPERDEAVRSIGEEPADRRLVVLEARQRFTPEAKLVLRVAPGVRAATGLASATTQTFSYTVRPPFTARLSCARENAKADCIPLLPVRLRFSEPVAWERVSGVVLRDAGDASVDRRWPAERVHADDHDALVDAVLFRGPFPPGAQLVADLPADLRDEAGRAPVGADRLALRTGPVPPLAKFAASFGVLESASPVLPVTLRRIEADAPARSAAPLVSGQVAARHDAIDPSDARAVLGWLRALDTASRDTSIFAASGLASSPSSLALPRPDGEDAFEVVGIPLSGPGLHVVEIESRVLGSALLGEPRPMYVPAGALVTDLGVHFKWGRESSLVWVTTLSRAEPVEGAQVTIVDCRGDVRFTGRTDASGLVSVAGLPASEDEPSCEDRPGYSAYDHGLLVVAAKAGDVGLAHSTWNEGIEPWRFGLPAAWGAPSPIAHTVLDRVLLRAGDTVHMKHLLRRGVQEGFAQVPPDDRPRIVRITHVGTDESAELPLSWAADGSAVTDWPVPREAKLGVYEVRLVPPGDRDWAEPTGRFRVEEFRVPLARGTLQPPAEPVVAARSVPVDLAVQYLGGGGASSLPVVLRSQLRRRIEVSFPDLEEFAFGRRAPVEGVRVRRFGEEEPDAFGFEGALDAGDGASGEPGADDAEGAPRPAVATQSLVLDAGGSARATIGGLPLAEEPLELAAELEFRDPAGEIRTAARTIVLWPAERAVGIAVRDPASKDAPLRVRSVVVDLAGDPLWRAKVEVDAYERRTYVTRKRLVGGFYAYEQVEEVRALGRLCAGRTDRRGVFACEAAPPVRGELVVVARSRDRGGRASTARADVFVPGSDDAWLAQGDGDRMDLLPEKKRWEPGDTARLQARMPFRSATALVTVEREGVSDAFVTKLSGGEPVVRVPLRAAFAPNVFVSVLALRGRITGKDAPAPTALVDLAKPAWRLGIAELRVGSEANALRVEVEPARDTWRVRERAQARVRVRTPDGDPPPSGSELAVAVVDEGLLELAPNASWGVLDAMMGRRSHAVETSTAQLQVVGKRHFGAKALAHGGGGGRLPTRELFDTLLLWEARVPLDVRGEAVLDIPLNDSLTSFRIAAVATSGDALFGHGTASIRTTQDLLVLPGIAPIARAGDRFRSELTVRNTTSRSRDVTLRARVEGLAEPLAPRTLRVPAGESQVVGFDVAVPEAAERLSWDVEIESGGEVLDRLRVAQKVSPAVPERVLQATLLPVSAGAAAPISVKRPDDAIPGRAHVDVSLRPRLADGQEGVARAMGAYPYTCLEQQVSTAVALRDRARWDQLAGSLPAYLDGDGLARFFPSMSRGSDVLTSYLLSLSHAAGLPLPEAARERMLAGLAGFVGGSVARESFFADLGLRKLAAIAALARHGRATPAMLQSLAIEPVLWPEPALLDWREILERVPDVPGREARRAEVDRLLRARLDVQGTSLGFASARAGGAPWLLATPDASAARLVLATLEAPAWREDVPRLVRGALALQRQGAWPTTMGNAWGVVALDAFSGRFEREAVTGDTEATLEGVARSLDWAATAGGGVLTFEAPDRPMPLALRHAGRGRPWALVLSRAAVPLREPLSSGYRIEKRLSPVSQRTPGAWSRGDVVRVRVEVDAEADASWVVVSDPIPAGSTILGSGLGGDSALAAQAEAAAPSPGMAFEAFTERSQEALRRYYEWAPKGPLVVEYVLRLNQSGSFVLPPTRVEAMYQPERMGELPNPRFEVAP